MQTNCTARVEARQHRELEFERMGPLIFVECNDVGDLEQNSAGRIFKAILTGSYARLDIGRCASGRPNK